MPTPLFALVGASTPLTVLVTRAAELVALGLAPFALSPAPSGPTPTGTAAAAALALAAIAGGAAWGRARLASKAAAWGAALAWLAVAASLGASLWADRKGQPIGLALPFVAPLVWGAIAAFAGAIAARAGKHVALGAAPVAVVGAALLSTAAPWVRSRDALAWRALALDPDDRRALALLTAPKLAARDLVGLAAIADRCLAATPRACPCLALRVEIAAARPGGDTRPGLVAAQTACPRDAHVHLLAAEEAARAGDATAAEREIATATVLDPDPGELAYARAVMHERAGRFPEALAAADEAASLGYGRDAVLLAAAVRIGENDLGAAKATLGALAAENPNDAEVRYDLALLADKAGDYNGAREGYLAALRLDPKLRAARYNLTVLTLRSGVLDEAKHHANAYIKAFPEDPAGAKLMMMVVAASTRGAE
jgi:tetratricopeptide (TPR) repeat protein